MKKREADFTIQFRHWLKENPMPSSAFELKQTTSDSIPFDCVQEHQIDALLAVKSKHGLLFKLPDDSRGIKPFDMFYLRNDYAFIVIRYPKHFSIIDVETFLQEKERSSRKSLTSGQAKQISIIDVSFAESSS